MPVRRISLSSKKIQWYQAAESHAENERSILTGAEEVAWNAAIPT